MKKIADSVVTLSLPREGELCLARFGVPCPKSAVLDIAALCLAMAGEPLQSQIEVLSTWPDGSLRWVFCTVLISRSGAVDLLAGEPGAEQTAAAPAAMTWVPGLADKACIQSAGAGANEALWKLFGGMRMGLQVQAALAGDAHAADGGQIAIQSSRFAELPLWQAAVPSSSGSRGALWQTQRFECVAAHYGADAPPNQRINLSVELGYGPLTGDFKLSVRAHNPGAAVHPNGCWDLGDAGSHAVGLLRLVLQASNTEGANATLLLADEAAAAPAQAVQRYDAAAAELQLRQTGSGGEHWKSPNHWNEHKQSTVTENGFQLSCGGEELVRGLRACPAIVLPSNEGTMLLAPQDFWQNFPMTLTLTNTGLQLDLFPEKTELCGGESKTWRFKGRLFSPTDPVPAPETLFDPTGLALGAVAVTYSQDYLNACQILPHIHFGGAPGATADLIAAGLQGPDNFYTKRERVDEYGWRNFGDLWADHECHGLESQPYFISHYNNQYDPLMGMSLQYLQQANTAWLDLITPLSQHIQDIDIYDTEQDKAEYNGGLFWHTNHYLPAETSGHRSYSKHHTAVYQDFQGGGGPGGQHCYTTGLALQYFLFGDQRAREKVMQLTRWVRHFYHGNGTLLDRTFRLLTIDIKQNVFTNIGIKAPGYRHPLDRGTGNYLIALLDCFDVTSDNALLAEAGDVIRNTCHPAEDIALRNLTDIENAWFYTVFLQAVGRFLFLKEVLGAIDHDYWYARQSLLHYGEWMLKNEAFYLDTPEKLEFPNDTWCAQDIRKANLFSFMYYFAEVERPEFLEKAQTFYTYVAQRLQNSPEAHYTRLLALLMQNDGVQQKFVNKPRSAIAFVRYDFGQPPAYKPLNILQTYLKDIFKVFCRLSIKRELAWLKLRLR